MKYPVFALSGERSPRAMRMKKQNRIVLPGSTPIEIREVWKKWDSMPRKMSDADLLALVNENLSDF
jgi:hypothetical protein